MLILQNPPGKRKEKSVRLFASAVVLAAIVGGLIAAAALQWSKPRPNRRNMPTHWAKHWCKVWLVTILAVLAVYGSSAKAMSSMIKSADGHKPDIPAAAKRELQNDAAKYFSVAPIDVVVTSYGSVRDTKGAYEATIATYYGGKLVSVVAQKAFMVNNDRWDFGCNIMRVSKPGGYDNELVFVPLSNKVLAAEFAKLGHCPLPTRSAVHV